MNTKSRRTVHLCVTSHDEVMFRCHEDYARAFNCFANAVYGTESRALADGFMSNHYHLCVQTDDYEELLSRMRFSYARYFNSRYRRKGRLGDRTPFTIQVDGVRHVAACLSYIYRQGLHHGVSSTAFGYPYTSANAIFQAELGRSSPEILMPARNRNLYLPSRSVIPDYVRMDSTGQLLREDVIDCSYVQEIFITPRTFLYSMIRGSDENWANEQKTENVQDAITLSNIERGVVENTDELLRNERGKLDLFHLNDVQICELIDKKYVPRYLKDSEERSVYLVPPSKRAEIADQFLLDLKAETRKQGNRKTYVTDAQLKRCLIL